jgi:Nucleotidyltransferase of unknown function (DUF6036)
MVYRYDNRYAEGMALLSRDQIIQALTRLGEIAARDGLEVQLVLVGGAVMALAYNARSATQDVDAIFLPPPEASQLRQWALLVASELELPEDWLNDGAKGFLNGLTIGPLLLSAPGIQVHQVTAEQLLAMKLSAWRDDTDINDAKRLLLEFPNLELEALWTRIEPFVIRGEELKARYALEDLWNAPQT